MDQPAAFAKPRILVAPLDWGLGHATRCIPIIYSLLAHNCDILLAVEGRIGILLQKEFPQLSFINLKGYHVSYSKSKWALPFVLAMQIPKILSVIKYENQRLKEIVKEHHIDAVISDNRYGLYYPGLPSVFITHQLMIQTNSGRLMSNYIQKINYRYINHFTECWVPDHKDVPNLSGELSHPEKFPGIPVRYVGPLSRFQKPVNLPDEKYLLILLSGPEPQRTILENLMMEELNEYKEDVVLVRGLPGEKINPSFGKHITVFNHLDATSLKQKMEEASIVISRSGYSTVMDLAALRKKSILIPTPGQKEQEYLAAHLTRQNFALCIDQKKFRLKPALKLAENFNYKMESFDNDLHLEPAVNSLIDQIRQNHQFK